MTGFALALVLVSAVTHATWNLLAKRSGADTAFLFVVYVVGAVAYAPFAIAIVVLAMRALGPLALGFVAVSVLLQTVYFATLTAGYRAGDLSLVYPLARATGPLLATAGAVAIFGERPTPPALAGALAIAVGALVLAGHPRALRRGGDGARRGRARGRLRNLSRGTVVIGGMSGYRRVCVLALAFLVAACGAQAVAPRANVTPAPSPSATETPRPTNPARDIVY